MRSLVLTGLVVLTLGASAAYAADAAQPQTTTTTKSTKSTTPAKTTKPKTTTTQAEQMSEAKRRDLERRIEALEQKYEMQYRETDSPTGAPGAKPAAH